MVRVSWTRGRSASISAGFLSIVALMAAIMCAKVALTEEASMDAPAGRPILASAATLILATVALFLASLPLRLTRITVELDDENDLVILTKRNGVFNRDEIIRTVLRSDFLGVVMNIGETEHDVHYRIEFRWRGDEGDCSLDLESCWYPKKHQLDPHLVNFVKQLSVNCADETI